MTGREDIEDKYREWWEGKYTEDGKFIKRVDFQGPPSGITGIVTLTFDDGTESIVRQGVNAYRPRKRDLKVFDENPTISKTGGVS